MLCSIPAQHKPILSVRKTPPIIQPGTYFLFLFLFPFFLTEIRGGMGQGGMNGFRV